MSISKFVVLAEDPFRGLCICGDECGLVFLATEALVSDLIDGVLSKDIYVVHVEESRQEVRVPQKVWYWVDGVQHERWPTENELQWPGASVIPVYTYVLPYGDTGGHYRLRAGYEETEKVWAISGEVKWVSALELELSRNREIDTTEDGTRHTE